MDLFPPEEQTPEAASALLKRELKLGGDVIRANNISGQEWHWIARLSELVPRYC